MDPEDVADDEFLSRLACGGDDLLGLLHRHGNRLFEEHVAAGGEGLPGVVGVGVGIGVDRDRVGPRGSQRRGEVGELRIFGGHRVEELASRLFTASDDAHDLELGKGVVGLGVRLPHVAAADDEDPDRPAHGGSLLRDERGRRGPR